MFLTKRIVNIFNSTDLNIWKIFKPLYIYLKIFGLFPYSFTFLEKKQLFKMNKKSIYFSSLCAISINIIIYTFFIVHIQDVLTTADRGFYIGAILSRLNFIIEMFSLLLVCNVIYICTFVNRRKYLHILNDISTVWLDFPTDIRIKILKCVYVQVYYIVITLFVSVVLIFIVNLNRNESSWKIILVTLTFIYPQMIQMTVLAFHHVLNIMLTSALTGMNELMQKMDIYKKNVALAFITVDETVNLSPLKRVESVYCKISKLTKDINEIFRAMILFTLLQCLHTLTSESYYIYSGFVTGTHTPFTLVNCCVWIIYQLLKVISVSYTGNLLKDETKQVANALHNIPTDGQDIKVLMETKVASTTATVIGELGFKNKMNTIIK